MMRTPALVLAYHSLTPWAGDPLGVSADAFRAQMDYLKGNGWSCITLSELVKHMEKGTRPNRRSFVLTFDDGYVDSLTVAAPILSAYDWSATVFVVTDLLEQGDLLPHDLQVIAQKRIHDAPQRRSLTWDEAGRLMARGFTIGSHTCSHRRLTLLDPEERAKELGLSAAQLTERLGTRDLFLCYPFGDADGTVIADARSAGYRAGVVTQRLGGLPGTRWTIRRAGIYDHDTLSRFAFKIRLASPPLRDVIRLLPGRGRNRMNFLPRTGPERVLQITSSCGVGGIERSLVRLVPALARCGTSCEVLHLKDGGPMTAMLEGAGITVRGLRARSPLVQARELRSLLQEGGYDVVHAYGTRAAFVARIASRFAGPARPRVITGVLSTGQERGTSALLVDALTRRWNDLYLSNSQAGAVALSRAAHLIPEAISVLYDGVEREAPRLLRSRDEIRASLGIGRQAPILICVANLRTMKGHGTLLNAFIQVRSEIPESRLLLVGDDRMQGRIQRQAAQLHPEGVVQFLGLRTDVEDLLAAADLFVLASEWEGLPISLLEAMRAGLPIVATAVSGIPEAVTNGLHGLLVQPRDARAMADAIVAVLKDPVRARRMGSRARARFVSQFTVDRTARELANVYADIAARRRGAKATSHRRRAA